MKESSNIFFSIKPKYIDLILNGTKKFEYRNRYWKVRYPSWFFIYESSPVSALKYMILLGKPYKKGDIIIAKSYGTERFNDFSMDRDYAYPILKVRELDNPITLKQLREIQVTPPQDFAYIDRRPLLAKHLISANFSDVQLVQNKYI